MKLSRLGICGIISLLSYTAMERFSTFSAVVFNAVLGIYLLTERFELSGGNERE